MSTKLQLDDTNAGTIAESLASWRSDTPVVLDRPTETAPELGTRLTFGDVAHLIRRSSAALASVGVRPMDRVVICKQNHADILSWAFGAARIGAVPVLLSCANSPADMEVMLQRAKPAFVLSDEATTAHGALTFDFGPLARTSLSIDGASPGIDIRPGLDADIPAPIAQSVDDECFVTHTSGTTGVPKLVQFSVNQGGATVMMQIRIGSLGFTRSDRIALSTSFVHARAVGGALNALYAGLPLLVLSRPLAPPAADLLAGFEPTIVEALPNEFLAWEHLADDDRSLFARTRVFHNTFDAIHPRTVRTLLQASRRRMPIWFQSWGQSEAGAVTAQVFTRRSVRRHVDPTTRRVGRPVPFVTRVKVVDPATKRRVRRGRTGVLMVRSPGMSRSYVGQEALHARRRRGTWWTMGDVGRRTATGAVELLDREIDSIDGVTSCIALEDQLLDRLASTTEVVIVKDAAGRPLPVVATVDDEDIDGNEWAAATAGLPDLEAPVRLPWTAIPRTGTMKVRRFALARQLEGPVDDA